MQNITINGKEVTVPDGITIIQACEIADIEIPRFCYHERLAIAGNCRMCLVEVEGGPPKPVASCAMPVVNGMKIHTDSLMVKKAREGVMEFLLINHPLDCPVCDQGGECDLQDQAYQYGKGESSYCEHKRSVSEKDFGPLIKTQMTRCIHCTRCVRFIEDVAGTNEIGAINRGENMEITTYLEQSVKSELSGNVIDLCPVGALTSKPYAFKSRSWELKKTESIDVMDSLCSNIRIDSRGVEVMRILPRLNEEINEEWISDKTRFCYDGLKYQRLDKYYIKENNKLKPVQLSEAFSKIKEKFKSLKSEEIACFTGSLSSLEEVFLLKSFFEKIGSKNYDCRLNDQKISSQDRSSYLFNSLVSGIDDCDLCLLVGVNPRKDSPVLNARIRKRFLTKKLKIFSVGVDYDLTYPYQNIGNNIETLEKILNEKNDFSKEFRNAKNPMIIVGEDAVSGNDGEIVLQLCKKIAEKFGLIKDGWNGFNFLAKSTGLINGLEIGFDARSTKEILEDCRNEKIKLVILHNVDDIIDFQKLKNSFVVYIGSHGDKGATIADVILPSSAYSEKDAIFINLEGRVQKTTKAVFAPNDVKDDSNLLIELFKNFDVDFDLKNIEDIYKKISEINPSLVELDKINIASWKKIDNNISLSEDLKSKEIKCFDYNFYLTNQIARSSKILNKCSGNS